MINKHPRKGGLKENLKIYDRKIAGLGEGILRYDLWRLDEILL